MTGLIPVCTCVMLTRRISRVELFLILFSIVIRRSLFDLTVVNDFSFPVLPNRL